MKFWPERLTVRLVCGVLLALVVAECLYAWSHTLPRQMGRFERRGLVLTVEEVPAVRFPEQFFGEAQDFYYRFTLASMQREAMCSSFSVYRGNSEPRVRRVEVVEPGAGVDGRMSTGADAEEQVLFVCALDGGYEVTCAGRPWDEIRWRSGWVRGGGGAEKEAADAESSTFLDDPEWQAEEKRAAAAKEKVELERGK